MDYAEKINEIDLEVQAIQNSRDVIRSLCGMVDKVSTLVNQLTEHAQL